MKPVSSPRLSMAHLPRVLQRPLTWVTGMPLPDQQPLFRWNPWTRALSGVLTTLFGVALSALAWAGGGIAWLLLPFGVLFTSGGLRALYLEIAHNAVHHAFGRSRHVDRLVTELFTLVTLTGGYEVFRREHVQKHHGKNATLEDPDYAALIHFGFEPGTSYATLVRRAWLSFVNPRIHLAYLAARLRANFLQGPPLRRLFALMWNGGMFVVVMLTGLWKLWLVAWVLPLVWGFQQSSLLQMISGEHRWGLVLPPGKEALQRLTYGRFLGDPYPERGRLPKAIWWFRLAFLHWPARAFVYVGNDIGPAHDVHHRRPSFDWPNAAYAREELRNRGELPGATDEWGSLVRLTAIALRGLSDSPPTQREPAG